MLFKVKETEELKREKELRRERQEMARREEEARLEMMMKEAEEAKNGEKRIHVKNEEMDARPKHYNSVFALRL